MTFSDHVEHIKTNCSLEISGTLYDSAKKIWNQIGNQQCLIFQRYGCLAPAWGYLQSYTEKIPGNDLIEITALFKFEKVDDERLKYLTEAQK
jgi:hypothetical protein